MADVPLNSVQIQAHKAEQNLLVLFVAALHYG